VLLGHVLNRPKSWVLAHGDYELQATDLAKLDDVITQYNLGIPLPYILGYWEFFGRRFHVTPDVLIPRPETELLIEKAIQRLAHFNHPLIIDVGTGSGAIAITLAAELPHALVIATDLSMAALKISQSNARELGQEHIQFVQADLLVPFSIAFNLICANLPYIPSQTLSTLSVSRWEPQLALDGGADGMAVILPLLKLAQKKLSSPGFILLEIEANLGQTVLTAANLAFPGAQISLHQDYAGHDRLVEIFKP
jgi:release factor glutamine methyltransferase